MVVHSCFKFYRAAGPVLLLQSRECHEEEEEEAGWGRECVYASLSVLMGRREVI